MQIELSDKIVGVFLPHAKQRHLSYVLLKLVIHSDRVIISSSVILDISFTLSLGGFEASGCLIGHAADFIFHEGIFLFDIICFAVTN